MSRATSRSMRSYGGAGTPSDEARAPVLAAVRRTVRGLLEQSPGFAQASPEQRKEVASKLVGVAMLGADLVAEDARLSEAAEAPPVRSAPLTAGALAAQPEFATAAKQAGQTFQDLRKAIDFPTYVTSLISGVFQAITASNINQLTAIGDLLDNVASSQDEFASSNIKDRDVIVWAVQKFPFIKSSDGEELILADDVLLDEKRGLLKSALDASDSEVAKIDSDDLLGTLGPLARRRIGRDRQAILATMVKMGLQRVVVDEGRLHASMDMRVDTRSVAERDQSKRDEAWLETGASAQVGMGAWGASAHVNAGFSRVESDHQYGKEEIDTRAGLRSSVDLGFRTEQIPLDKWANEHARVKIDNASRVPANVDNSNLLTTQQYATAIDKPNNLAQADKSDSANAAKAREDAANKKAEKDKREADKAEADKAKDKKPETPPAAEKAKTPAATGENKPAATGENKPAVANSPPAPGPNKPKSNSVNAS